MRTNANALSMVLVLVLVTAGIGSAAMAATSTAGGPAAMTGVQAQQGRCSFPVTLTDAGGTEVTIEEEPQRVVVLGASAAQIMWEIGAKEKVVGMPVTPYTAYLNGSRNRTGTFKADGFTVATETVVSLNPDLVIAPGIIPNQTVSQLRSVGITVYNLGFPKSIEGTYELVNQTGRLVGACEGAERIVDAMQTRVSTIHQAVRDEPEPRVLYGTNFVAGNNTLIGDIIETAGAENLAANAGISDFKKISDEVVAERNPQWLVVTNASQVPEGAPWAGTTAVQQNQIIVVNANYISQPAPRMIFPLTEIARTLHPEAMQSVNLTETPIGPANLDTGNATATTTAGATATATDDGTATATTTTGTTTDGGTAATTTAGTATSGTTAGTATSGTTARMTTGGADGGETTGMDGDETTAGAAGDGATANQPGTTAGNGPGFGLVAALVALVCGTLFALGRE